MLTATAIGWACGLGDTVRVLGKRYIVSVHQESKSVWVAVADYMGEPVECRASCKRSALASWQEIARYKGEFRLESPGKGDLYPAEPCHGAPVADCLRVADL
jgi:hypothetical protein